MDSRIFALKCQPFLLFLSSWSLGANPFLIPKCGVYEIRGTLSCTSDRDCSLLANEKSLSEIKIELAGDLADWPAYQNAIVIGAIHVIRMRRGEVVLAKIAAKRPQRYIPDDPLTQKNSIVLKEARQCATR